MKRWDAQGLTCTQNAILDREAGPIKQLRRPLSAWVNKLITAALYAVSLAALISVVMVVSVAIGGSL